MWKYAAAKGVHATPTGFANGTHIDNLPFSVPAWMHLLNEIYESQYQAPTNILN